ncbi:MAG: DUF3108 domain-containing protein [Alphaproteobacteria bacterium]|nr:DUF3108 domain-containing protein [Alphaproteobacteria bacterium]
MTRRPLLPAALAACLLVPAGADLPARAAGGAGAQVSAQPASKIQMAMTIYAGGITLGKVDMDATIRGGDYHVVSNLTTSGVVNAFWQAEIQATSSGKVGADSFQPALYDSFDIGHAGKKQEVSLTYDNGGAPRLYADPVYSVTGYEVKPDQQKGTLDPLSAVMFIVSGAGAKADNPCGLVAPVFDGRRRYNIEMKKVRDIDIDMDNGLYKGKGLLCAIKYKQLAGFKPRVIKNNESFPTINAWITTVHSDVTGRDYVVPLRVWADTKYGVVAVLASTVKVDGSAPSGIKS